MSTETVTGLPRKQGGRRGPLLPYEQARKASAWLAGARKASRLTAAGLGHLMHASPGWVQGRESGGTRMTQAEVNEIAAALGVPVPDLTGKGGAR
jgi:transcriptional regulator with XRE-family HTH domain